MFVAIVPAKNEQGRIGRVLQNLTQLPIDLIVPVINGSSDGTLEEALGLKSPRVHILYFQEALGIDIPRAIGAKYAANLGAGGILFVDGDMGGNIQPYLRQLIDAVQGGVDLALSNCFPSVTNRNTLANQVLHYRGRLNREIGLSHSLGLSSPSHGPLMISSRLLDHVPIHELAIPPVILPLAKQADLNIRVATAVPHHRLGSGVRSNFHNKEVAHTIIGDCLEAICVARGLPRRRQDDGQIFMGYHASRRWDILKEFFTPWKKEADL